MKIKFNWKANLFLNHWKFFLLLIKMQYLMYV